jgi:cation channel sperm-associated protein 3
MGDTSSPKTKARRSSLVDRLAKRKSVIEDLNKQFLVWQKQQAKLKGEEEDDNPQFSLRVKPYRVIFKDFIRFVVTSALFENIVFLTIFINAITIALETWKDIQQANNKFLLRLDIVYISIYTSEFILKVIHEPQGYWTNRYNKFDALILSISVFSFLQNALGLSEAFDVTFLRVFRSFRAMRAFRSISFIRDLQVIVNALYKTMANVMNLVCLLMILMYVFGILAYYSYGYDANENSLLVSVFMLLLFYFSCESRHIYIFLV